jgi:hypothetical protein
MDWTSFYTSTAGASATLMGLLFIGVQFNIDLFLDDVTNRWHAIALSTFGIFTLLFLISLCFLVPALNDDGRSYLILFAVAIGVVRAFITWRPVARSAGALLRSDQFARTFWMLLAPIILYGVMAVAAIGYYFNRPAPLDQFNIAIGLIGLFSVCLRNSWRLFFDVAVERRKNKRKD